MFLHWYKYTKKHTANKVNSWRLIISAVSIELSVIFNAISKKTVNKIGQCVPKERKVACTTCKGKQEVNDVLYVVMVS